MINPAVFIGEPLTFKNKILIYPPKVKEVLTLPGYGQYVFLLTITQEDIQDELNKHEQFNNYPTPLEFLLINAYQSESFALVAKAAFRFFLKAEVDFNYNNKSIVVKLVDSEVVITEQEYFDFQNAVREAIGSKPVKRPEPIDPNENPKIARMKAKARERDRIKAKKGVQGGISLSTSLVAICCMELGITPLNIGEMSYAAVGPIISMMQNKEKYDTDIRSILAGADSKKVKPKYWIRNSDEK